MANHGEQTRSVLLDVTSQVQLRVLLRKGGNGCPYLFVHGLASNARLWDGVAKRLAAAGHDSVAVDLRGHGESSQIHEGFDFGTLSNDLRTVIARTSNRPVIAVGQSWGGNVTLELAARHPEQVAAISLIDGGFIRLGDDLPDWPDAKRRLTPPAFEGMTLESMRVAMRSRLNGFPEEALEAQLANLRATKNGSVTNKLSLDNHLTILRHLWEHDPDPVGAAVSAPIQVMAVPGGSPSKSARVDSFAKMSGAEVHWIDGHHDVHAQQPDRVAELLLNLADRLES